MQNDEVSNECLAPRIRENLLQKEKKKKCSYLSYPSEKI